MCLKALWTFSSCSPCLRSNSLVAVAIASFILSSHCFKSADKCLLCTSFWEDRAWISATYKKKKSHIFLYKGDFHVSSRKQEVCSSPNLSVWMMRSLSSASPIRECSADDVTLLSVQEVYRMDCSLNCSFVTNKWSNQPNMATFCFRVKVNT